MRKNRRNILFWVVPQLSLSTPTCSEVDRATNKVLPSKACRNIFSTCIILPLYKDIMC